MGFMDEAVFSKQTVEFICQVNTPCEGVKWLKDGKPVSPHKIYKKYEMTAQFGTQHTLIVHDVTMFDQGIYTFKVIELGAKIKTDTQTTRGVLDTSSEYEYTISSPKSPDALSLPVVNFAYPSLSEFQPLATSETSGETEGDEQGTTKPYLYRLHSVN